MNFKHLRYFWVTAREGSLTRACAVLHLSAPTLSTQIKLLEERLGTALFRRVGRRLVLTDAGQTVLRYADEIFALGQELEGVLRHEGAGARTAELRIGISDAVPKSIAYRLIEPALNDQSKLVCHEGRLEGLVAALSVHRLDLIIADVPLPRHLSVKAYNHSLGRSDVAVYAAPAIARLAAKRSGPPDWAALTTHAPALLPSADTALRARIDRWLETHGLQARIAAEFDDTALMKAFAREGRGYLFAPVVLDDELSHQYGLKRVGNADDIYDEYHAISIERRITHPSVAVITQTARDDLFAR